MVPEEEWMKPMYIIASLFAAVLVGLLVWQVQHIIVVYNRSVGTSRQKFMAAFSDSITILWGRFLAFSGAVLTFLTTALPLLDPGSSTGATVASLFTPETLKYWLAGLTLIGLLVEVFRRAPASVDPITPPPIGTGAAISPLAPQATKG